MLCVTLEILYRLKENYRGQHWDTSQLKDAQRLTARLDDLIEWKVSLPMAEDGTRSSLGPNSMLS